MKPIVLLICSIIFTTGFAFDKDSLIQSLKSYEGVEKSIQLNILSENSREENIKKARSYAQLALEISKQLDSRNQIALSYKNLGICDYYESNYKDAIANYKEAENYYKKADNIIGLAHIYNNIAIIKNLQNETEEAIALYQKSLSINLENNDSNQICLNYINIGTVYDRLRNYDEALKYYTNSLNFSTKNQYKIHSLVNIAAIFSSTNKIDEALSLYKQALSLAKEEKQVWLMAKISQNVANNHIKLGQYKRARTFLDQSMELCQGSDLVELTSNAYLLYAQIYFQNKDFKTAISYNEKCIETSKVLGISETRLAAFKNLSETYQELGQYKKALHFQDIYIELKDSLVNIENHKIVSELQTKYETEKAYSKVQELEKENHKKQLENAQKDIMIEQEKVQKLWVLFIAFSILFGGAIVGFIFYRKQTEKKHKAENQQLETEQQLLRSQMNPHFIFNALSSIQSFIMTNDSLKAGTFLSKFSLLIRNVLENSSTPFVSLDKELETLELFMEMEQMRYDNSFTYKIDNHLDDMFIQIPPMIIQPFVENAIIHGIRNRNDIKGKLHILLTEASENSFYCEIIDNGIGRAQSKKLQEGQKRHQSFATKLTSERLKKFSKESKTNFSIEIIDLFDDEQQACGTKVKLYIPFH